MYEDWEPQWFEAIYTGSQDRHEIKSRVASSPEEWNAQKQELEESEYKYIARIEIRETGAGMTIISSGQSVTREDEHDFAVLTPIDGKFRHERATDYLLSWLREQQGDYSEQIEKDPDQVGDDSEPSLED